MQRCGAGWWAHRGWGRGVEAGWLRCWGGSAPPGTMHKLAHALTNTRALRTHMQDQRGWTALCCACKWGQAAIVRLLLRAPGIDVNAAPGDNMASRANCTPLVGASRPTCAGLRAVLRCTVLCGAVWRCPAVHCAALSWTGLHYARLRASPACARCALLPSCWCQGGLQAPPSSSFAATTFAARAHHRPTPPGCSCWRQRAATLRVWRRCCRRLASRSARSACGTCVRRTCRARRWR